jgi:hypothetical protein
MAKNIKSSIVIMGMAILTGLMGWVARADVQLVAFKLSSGGSTNTPCSGAYTGYARMTNSAVVTVLRQSDFASWCQTNSVTFPATNGTSYELTLWVKSTPPPPTNGQPLSLQIVWH